MANVSATLSLTMFLTSPPFRHISNSAWTVLRYLPATLYLFVAVRDRLLIFLFPFRPIACGERDAL